MVAPIGYFIVMAGGVAIKYATKKLAQQAAKKLKGKVLDNPSQKVIDKAMPYSKLVNKPTTAETLKAHILGIAPKRTTTVPKPGRASDKDGVAVGKLQNVAKDTRKFLKGLGIGGGAVALALSKSDKNKKTTKSKTKTYAEMVKEDKAKGKNKVLSRRAPETPPRKPKKLRDKPTKEELKFNMKTGDKKGTADQRLKEIAKEKLANKQKELVNKSIKKKVQ
jgi:hypothetical protein